MSLEHSLERIAVALEALVASKAGANVAVPKSKTPASVATAGETTQQPVPSPAATQTSVPDVAPAANVPAPAGLIIPSPEECNTLLVAEFNRLGKNPQVMQRILGIMESQFNVRSVMDLTKEQYGPLIAVVRELK